MDDDGFVGMERERGPTDRMAEIIRREINGRRVSFTAGTWAGIMSALAAWTVILGLLASSIFATKRELLSALLDVNDSIHAVDNRVAGLKGQAATVTMPRKGKRKR